MAAADLAEPDEVDRVAASDTRRLSQRFHFINTESFRHDEPILNQRSLKSIDQDAYRPATDEERHLLKIRPDLTDVHVAVDPNARRIAFGKDAKGRTQSVYSAAHTSIAQAEKFERLRQFDAALPDILKRIHADIANGSVGKEEAAVLRLIQLSAFRNGGDGETGGKVKAHGASNLRAEHVRVEGDTAHFNFVGKLGVRQQHSIRDEALAQDMRERAAKGGALFDTNSAKVLDYLKESGDFKVHDFRTWNATDTALRETQSKAAPKTTEEFWNERDRIGDIVAKKLGDSRKIVLKSYIDPTVFEGWKSDLGITDETRPKRQGKVPASDVKRSGEIPSADERFLRDQLVPGEQSATPFSRAANPGGAIGADAGRTTRDVIGRAAGANATGSENRFEIRASASRQSAALVKQLRDGIEVVPIEKLKYRWKVNKDPNGHLGFDEVFLPKDGSAIIHRVQNWDTKGATESPVATPWTLDPLAVNNKAEGIYRVLTVELRATGQQDGAGIPGCLVPSNKTDGSGAKHFVVPKSVGGAVTITANLGGQAEAGMDFDSLYEFVPMGANATISSNTCLVKTDNPGKYTVQVRTKDSSQTIIASMNVWVVWAVGVITNQPQCHVDPARVCSQLITSTGC